MQIIPCSICLLCACFQIVICILAPFLKDDLLQEIIHVVVEFLADLMILFLCSAKLVSCALKPNRAGADIDKSAKIPPPPPLYLVSNLVSNFFNTNKYADHKIFHDDFERGEFLSYNSAFLASISNTVLKGSGKENYSNIHYVKMTAVQLLNFSADKFSFSPFLAVVALANVIRAPVKP